MANPNVTMKTRAQTGGDAVTRLRSAGHLVMMSNLCGHCFRAGKRGRDAWVTDYTLLKGKTDRHRRAAIAAGARRHLREVHEIETPR